MAAAQQDSRASLLFVSFVRYLEPLRAQVAARKQHLLKSDFKKALMTSPEIAQTYTSSALKMTKASMLGATNVRLVAKSIARDLKTAGRNQSAKTTEKIGIDIFQLVQKETILWGTLNEVIGQLRSKDKKTAKSAAAIIPVLRERLRRNLDEELTLIDKLIEMTRSSEQAA